MNYKLNKSKEEREPDGVVLTFAKMWELVRSQKRRVFLALLAMVGNSGLTLLSPFIIGYTINNYIVTKDYHGVLLFSGLLIVIYIGALISNYLQVRIMGGVGQEVLYNLRNDLFKKLESLPLAFFNQNKAGDLISRLNNDTGKLNQFFSQALMQFVGSIFVVIGSGFFLLFLNWRLGLAVLAPAVLLLLFTRLTSGWIRKKNLEALKSTGALSAEISESLANFKVIVAFSRRDYFRKRFAEANDANYGKAAIAGVANNVLGPTYDFASNVAQLIFLAYGIYLISTGHLEIGFFISFLTYINRFYDPLRQMAGLWSTFQTALAAWDRISEILALESDLPLLSAAGEKKAGSLLSFDHVSFVYPEGKRVLEDVSFDLERGKTYALVGPTGGGKTTTASLMARLFDPAEGSVSLDGRDIRTYGPEERTKKVGFILQEPFLFNGTVRENILYGNTSYGDLSKEDLEAAFKNANLEKLLTRFPEGLDTEVKSSGDTMSLGQKQLIAFMRALFREPELLILDEATANIDTVTEALLEEILEKLPKETTKVIIAHRLNTIENADHIFFVNGSKVTPAGSFEHAVEMLLHGKRES